MQTSPSFSDLLAQPGPSMPPSPVLDGGGIVLNDSAKQVTLQSPYQQARVRTQESLNRLKTLAMNTAKENPVGF